MRDFYHFRDFLNCRTAAFPLADESENVALFCIWRRRGYCCNRHRVFIRPSVAAFFKGAG